MNKIKKKKKKKKRYVPATKSIGQKGLFYLFPTILHEIAVFMSMSNLEKFREKFILLSITA